MNLDAAEQNDSARILAVVGLDDDHRARVRRRADADDAALMSTQRLEDAGWVPPSRASRREARASRESARDGRDRAMRRKALDQRREGDDGAPSRRQSSLAADRAGVARLDHRPEGGRRVADVVRARQPDMVHEHADEEGAAQPRARTTAADRTDRRRRPMPPRPSAASSVKPAPAPPAASAERRDAGRGHRRTRRRGASPSPFVMSEEARRRSPRRLPAGATTSVASRISRARMSRGNRRPPTSTAAIGRRRRRPTGVEPRLLSPRARRGRRRRRSPRRRIAAARRRRSRGGTRRRRGRRGA